MENVLCIEYNVEYLDRKLNCDHFLFEFLTDINHNLFHNLIANTLEFIWRKT